MKRLFIAAILFLFCVGLALAETHAADFERIEVISLVTRKGWILRFYKDGSAELQYGSSFGDGATTPEGTFSFKNVYDKLVQGLKKGRESGDVSVAFHVLGTHSTRAKYIEFELAKPYLRKAAQVGKPFNEARFKSLLGLYPVDVKDTEE
jgi:hypothetical protein